MTVKDMLGGSGVVSREEALKVLDVHLVIPDLSVEESSISNALGRVFAQDIISPSDLPSSTVPPWTATRSGAATPSAPPNPDLRF